MDLAWYVDVVLVVMVAVVVALRLVLARLASILIWW